MYSITSGNILADVLYLVYGSQSVIYNGVTYTTGQTFRGARSISTFTFFGAGTQIVYELLELQASALIFDENAIDYALFSDVTKLNGFSIEYQQNANDIIFNDITAFYGFAMELLDYPFYSFQISETRL